MAKKIYRKHNARSLLILKYIRGVDFRKREYADYIEITKDVVGKMKVLFYSVFPVYQWKKCALYYFNDRDPISKNAARWCCKKVLVEEGIGTYFSGGDVKVIGNTIIPDIAYVGYPLIYRINHRYDCKIKLLNYKVFLKEEELAQYWPDRVQISDSADLLFLGQITATNEKQRELENNPIALLHRLSPELRILIKPHPRDDHMVRYTTKAADLIDSRLGRLPVEMIVSKMKVRYVVTMCSSAAVTLSNMFGDIDVIMTFCFGDFDKKMFMEQLRPFAEGTENFFIPETEAELKNILDRG